MRKWFPLLLALVIALTGCAGSQSQRETLACTTYPVYLLAQTVTRGADGPEPVLVVDQPLSCLHNYTLTMSDMKLIDAAAAVAINGAGMEEFLEDVLDGRECIDCSQGIDLLWNEEEDEPDSHIWLDPDNAAQMALNLADGLSVLDPDNAETYRRNAEAAGERLRALGVELRESLAPLPCRSLITFHDGFSYFAQAMDLEIAASVEEEEGSEASARRIQELTELIDEKNIPAVFTETNGPDATAKALALERPVQVAELTMLMSSRDNGLTGLDAYEQGMRDNAEAIREAYGQ
jgi:ABC-type Zn uptake system ZnuABC Zn-binding protein ZnuA